MELYAADLRFLPSPVRLEHYQFVPRTKPAPRLLWLRTFAALYNPLLALETIQQLQAEFPDIHLSMIGAETDDGTFQSFTARLAQLKLTDHVTLVGRIPKGDVPRYLQQGDIFINTTNVDNTPISVIEALACGLCVVSTNVGGIPYLLRHEHDALLVPPNDPQAMADAVRRILTEPGLAEHLSRNARATAEQYDWSSVLPQWEALLCDVVERHHAKVN
jgi:glycosyltransferase involved in cell wall biosynthesis